MVQRTRVIRTRKKYSGESSPYWDWINNEANKNAGGKGRQFRDNVNETPLANPDVMAESEGLKYQTDEATREIAELIREAMTELSPQERRAVELMAEGKSFRDAAKKMNANLSTFRNYIMRARKKVQDYVTQNRP